MRFCLLWILSGIASLALLWFTQIPLGVPGEWTWERISLTDDNRSEVVWGAVSALIFLVLYLSWTLLVGDRLQYLSRRNTAAALGGLVVFAFAWQIALQESPPTGYRLSKIPWVLYYPGASGYFFEARYGDESAAELLAGYEARMQQGDVLHEGTHPPGLFLCYKGLLAFFDWSPAAVRTLNALQPASVQEAFDVIADNNRGSDTPLHEADRAVIWAAALLTQLAGVLVIVPFFLLVRRDYSRETAWRAASLWPLVPAMAVFVPKSDVLYPLLALTFLYLITGAARLRSLPRVALAALVLLLSLGLTLAFLPILLIGALLFLGELFITFPSGSDRSRALRFLLRATATTLGTGAVPLIVLWWFFDLNLLHVWQLNLANHAGFYDQFPRTWWKWVLVNPVELTLALGAPVALAALSSIARALRQAATHSWSPQILPGLVCPLVWALLWLSGKNQGEAARLWILLMPLALWWSADQFSPSGPPAEQSTAPSDSPTASKRLWVCLLFVQAVLCLATVVRVSGFHFG